MTGGQLILVKYGHGIGHRASLLVYFVSTTEDFVIQKRFVVLAVTEKKIN